MPTVLKVGLVVAIATTSLVFASPPVRAQGGAVGASTNIVVDALPVGVNRFVDAAYQDFLGRRSDRAGREYWVGRMARGLSRGGFTGEVARSNEWTVKVVRRSFLDIVRREPSTAERDLWVPALRSRSKKVADLLASLYGSQAYATLVGTGDALWLDAVYRTVLVREPTAAESSAALARIASTPRQTEARRIVLSVEANGYRVDSLYLQLLNRGTDPSGRSFWAKRLVDGDDIKLSAQLASSAEYDRRAQERYLSGSFEKPATTVIVPSASVQSASAAGSSAIAVIDASALPSGSTHLVLPPSSGFPSGWIGTVTAVSGMGSTRSVTLAPARWDQAFVAGQLAGRLEVPRPVGSTSAVRGGPGAGSQRGLCSGSGNSFDVETTSDIGIDVAAGWGPFSEDYLRFALVGTVGSSVDLFVGGALACDLSLPGWTIPFAIGPIPFTAEISPTFRLEAELGARLTASASLSCTIGGEWREGTTTDLSGCNSQRSSSSLEPDLYQGTAQAELGIAVAVKAGGVLGLEAQAGPVIEAKVAPLDRPWWTVKGSAEAGLALVFDAWILSARIDVATFTCCEFEIASATSDPPAPGHLAVSTASLPQGRAGSSYDKALAASRGIGPYRWRATGLPTGLTIADGSDRITGSPTKVGDNQAVVLYAKDQRGVEVSRSLSLTVRPAVEPVISPASLPDAVLTEAYDVPLSVSGLTGTPAWSVVSGSLPPGISLNASTGRLTGMAATKATSSFSIRAASTTTSVVAAYTLDVTTPPQKGRQAIAAGTGHTCAIVSGATVRCWGFNGFGQLGDGTTTRRLAPVTVTGLTGARALAADARSTCAIVSGGTVRCWGSFRGAAGEPFMSTHLTPVTIPGVTNAVEIVLGDELYCVLVSDGRVLCWGNNSSGSLGSGDPNVQNATPTPVVGINTATSIAAGANWGCAVLADGNVRCWGRNDQGQLGDGTTTDRSRAVAVTGLSGAIRVSAKQESGRRGATCALLANGGVRCWGTNDQGQLGDETHTSSSTPVAVSGVSGAIDVAVGANYACAIKPAGMTCWGLEAGFPPHFRSGREAKLGAGERPPRLGPVQVLGITAPTSLTVASWGDSSGSYGHTCAVDGPQLKCWGDSFEGEVGLGIGAWFTPQVVTGL